MCENYNPNMCNQVWMKRHCKKLCGLCTPPEDEISLSSAPSEETSGPKHCEYSGVIHQSGETWSPGPCVPKCHCNNGIIKCSKLECPDLNCDKPIKRRWKCCPECLPNSDNETRCGVDTTGGNAENLCCVFPFNYRGIDYFTCTTADAQEPWCSITRNYDRDGLWGNCVAKSETEKKHVKQADSDEKTALVLAAQLSGARKWRNSTNNQATEALKDVQNPLSQKDLDQLKASDSPSAYSDNAYKNTSGADVNSVYQNDPSAQDEYYRNAGADPSQLKTLSYASQGNSTPPVTSPATTSSSSSTSQVTSNGGNPSNAYQQTTSSAYGDSYAKESNPVASSTPESSTSATNPADSNPVAPSSPAPSIAEASPAYSNPVAPSSPAPSTAETNPRDSNPVAPSSPAPSTAEASPADSNPVAPSSPAPSTAETNPRDSNPVAPSSPAPSIAEANPADSNPVAPSSPAPSPAEANPVASNAAGSNTPASSQYYGDANSSSGVSAYSNSYGQQSTAKDTTDNTVPNGIENQTSYEMNPDASTAQYANTQPAST